MELESLPEFLGLYGKARLQKSAEKDWWQKSRHNMRRASWCSKRIEKGSSCLSIWRFLNARLHTILQPAHRSYLVCSHAYSNWELDGVKKSTYWAWTYSNARSRGDVRCNIAVATGKITNVPQEGCQLFILTKSPGHRPEGFLLSFDCSIQLYPNAGSRASQLFAMY